VVPTKKVVGTKLSNEAKRSTRKGRPNHPIEFKLRLAQQACEPGVSVSKLAQEHGINANQLFKWRRHYRAGLFDAPTASTALLPVSLVDATTKPPRTDPPAAPITVASRSGIEIAFDNCTLRIDSATDMKLVRAVLALLRR
jgi:transposase